MRELPMLMTAENYAKCVDGSKTQTRRIMRPQPDRPIHLFPYTCPYPVGTRLWVREPFRIAPNGIINWCEMKGWYTNDGNDFAVKLTADEYNKCCLWKKKTLLQGKSPLFMFKSLARLWLEVTEVRVERLQDISVGDVEAEGVSLNEKRHPCDQFQILWDSINKDRADWDSNPWVWVISFRKDSK